MRWRSRGYLLVALGLLLAACEVRSPNDAVLTEGGAQTGASSTKAEEKPLGPPLVDIGDIEVSFKMDAVVADESKTPETKIEELVNRKQELDLVTVTAPPPVSPEFWVDIQVKCPKRHDDIPIAFRAKITRDKTTIDTFAFVCGPGRPFEPTIKKVNVLNGLDAVPKTLLVHAQAEVLRLPDGTDLASVDPNAVAASRKETGAVLSNPVRIDFGATEGTGAHP